MASNQMWQTEFTYLKVIGWGWFHLSTILDDVSRQVIGWSNMRAEDVTETLDIALAASGRDSARVFHKPRLLGDNGSSCITEDLAKYREDKGIKHVRGAPMHPQTQGKIERWHQILKNHILLETYVRTRNLEAAIATFIDHWNTPPPPREHREPRPGRCPLSLRRDHAGRNEAYQTANHPEPRLEPPASNGTS